MRHYSKDIEGQVATSVSENGRELAKNWPKIGQFYFGFNYFATNESNQFCNFGELIKFLVARAFLMSSLENSFKLILLKLII